MFDLPAEVASHRVRTLNLENLADEENSHGWYSACQMWQHDLLDYL